MARDFPILGAVDLGTSKVSVLLSEMTPEGLEVVGYGHRESHGMRKGIVTHLDSMVTSVTEAFEEARNLARREPDVVVTGISGNHVQTNPSNGMVPVRGSEITAHETAKAIETASAVNIPVDREIIQVVPEEFILDGQEGIRDPLGMFGKRLEVRLQIISGAVTPLENIRRCLGKAGLKVNHFVSNAIASAHSTLREDERESGVCMIDIGAAATDICVYQEGAFRWLRSLPIGGLHLTNDLAVGLKTTLQEAQKLKHHYGIVVSDYVDEEIEIPGLADLEPRRIYRRMLATILQPRVDEILGLIKNELSSQGLDDSLASGVVITGGGSLLKGLLPSAERIFRLPVRLGKPEGMRGLSDLVASPACATVVGLAESALEMSDELQFQVGLFQQKGIGKMRRQLGRWMRDFF